MSDPTPLPHPATPLKTGRNLFEALHRAQQKREPGDDLESQDLRLWSKMWGGSPVYNRSRQARENGSR